MNYPTMRQWAMTLVATMFLGLVDPCQAIMVVGYTAQPGQRNVVDASGAPLAEDQHVWLGTFPVGYNPAAPGNGPRSWRQSWVSFHETRTRSIFNEAGRFSASASRDLPEVTGRRMYLFLFQTANAEPPASDLSNVTGLGLFSAGGAANWIFPNGDAMPPGNRQQITSSEVSEAFGTANFDDSSLKLQAYSTGQDLSVGQSYEAWATSHGLMGPDALPEASAMHDGVANLLKYACNLNPKESTPPDLTPGTGLAGLPSISLIALNGHDHFRYEYVRRKGAFLVYTPQKSFGLNGTWSAVASTASVAPIDAEWERVIHQEPLDPQAERAFARVLVAFP